VLFEGYLRAYVEGREETDESAEDEAVLPPLARGDRPQVAAAEPVGHSTKPPGRYSEAGLVQKLEELGIGRPSTYASIIATILDREYCTKRGTALVPTPLAFAVVQLVTELEPTLVDYSFTAGMEESLDAIARGELDRNVFLEAFYKGQSPGLHAIVNERSKGIDPKEVSTIPIGEHDGEPVVLRVGRFGPYLEHKGQRASVPADLAPDEVTVARALELLETAGKADEPLGFDQQGHAVYLRTGAFGPYVQLGEDTGDKKNKPKRASIFKSMDPRNLSLEQALMLLSLPRELGRDAEGHMIRARPGRFGPYMEKLVEGAEKPETRSLKSEEQIFAITLEEAVALFAIPKRGRAGAQQTVLKELGVDPVSGTPIQLKDGRYGPYVTDGETNASLPKGANPDACTPAEAQSLLAERRKAGPSKKKARKQTGARKAAKETATKRSPAKKATKAKPAQGSKQAPEDE
ncbi:MAG TPA: topoisomerase C-terminal repeat-containing protein, partial [Planctomycetota bacterium]|nr:topoisomerase C-terminal repeat-containing protein [Planctomycetota bacterium]